MAKHSIRVSVAHCRLESGRTLDQTWIVAMGEFGFERLGLLNLNNGRDHHLQQIGLCCRREGRGMRAIGATNSHRGGDSRPRLVQGPRNKPEDIEATIYSALGIDWTTVRRDDPFNRGFEYVPFSEQDVYGPINRTLVVDCTG